jgi:hypothetical protein
MLPWVLPLLGFLTAGLARDFARDPLSRFAPRTTNRPTRRRPRVSINLRPASSVAPWQATALAQGDPSRVLAPARSRTFGRRLPPGYVFTAHCVVHYCRPTNDSWGYLLALPELPGSAEVPSFCDLREVVCSWRPSECSVWLLGPRCYHRGSSSSGIGCSSRVPRPPTYRPYWLGGSTLPLAIPSAVWFFAGGLRWSLVQRPVEPSLRVSPPSRVLPSQT